jgi:polysaccharide pyruvyl transferase WcaK-like protein
MDAIHRAETLSARQRRFLSAPDPDSVLLEDFQALIEQHAAVHIPSVRRPGPLRILLLGYCGAGNTGADVRTIEIIRQLRRLCVGHELDLSLFACGDIFDHPVLQSVRRLIPGSAYLPEVLEQEIPGFDVVLNVEGSTYTSKFSDALAALLIGGVGLAAAHGLLACAYGVDSGEMTPRLTQFAKHTARRVDIMCRSAGAERRLEQLGLTVQPGADTAWGFRADPGSRPDLPQSYVALCPNNPYWWPVRTDVRRAFVLDAKGETSPLRYGPCLFHSWDESRAQRYAAYRQEFSDLAVGLRQQGHTPVLVAMEVLDRVTCEQIAASLPFEVQVLSRATHDLNAIVATLEGAQWVVTTRYHAAVLALSNRVPVIGVSMDTRIDQLFAENGLADWIFSCDTPHFAELALARIVAADQTAGVSREGLQAIYGAIAATQFERFEVMGRKLSQRMLARWPGQV